MCVCRAELRVLYIQIYKKETENYRIIKTHIDLNKIGCDYDIIAAADDLHWQFSVHINKMQEIPIFI